MNCICFQSVLSASPQEPPQYPYIYKQSPVFVIHMLSSCPYQVTEYSIQYRDSSWGYELLSMQISCPIAWILSPDVTGQMRGGQVPSALQLWGLSTSPDLKESKNFSGWNGSLQITPSNLLKQVPCSSQGQDRAK